MRVFGYFLHEQKVTRVWGGEPHSSQGPGLEAPPKPRCGPVRPTKNRVRG